jgi:TRAP-type C4-dicarboxylate transport system permease small subunit
MHPAFLRVGLLFERAWQAALIIVLGAVVIVGGLQVFNRFVFNVSLSWSEEFQRYGQAWLVFLGIPVAYTKAMHIGTDFFVQRLPPAAGLVLSRAIDICWIVLGGVFIVSGYRIMTMGMNQMSPGLGVSMGLVYSIIVVSGIYLVVLGAVRFWTGQRSGVVSGDI